MGGGGGRGPCCSLPTIPPSWEKIPPVEGTGVAQLVARSTPDRCVVDSSPTHGTEHFGFPPSAPRLGNQRPWYVQPRLAATGHIKDPVPLIEKRRGLQRRSQVSLAGGGG